MVRIISLPNGSSSRLCDSLLGLKVEISDVELRHCSGAVLPAQEPVILHLVPLTEELLEDRGLEPLDDALNHGGPG